MNVRTAGLQKLSLGEEIVGRINVLGAISETSEHLARIFLTKEHRAAADLILTWMREAGMAAHLDAIGNVCGRYEGASPGLPCLMLGSHYDTVRDAGKWDGPLGLITAISCVADLNRRGKRLPFAVEVTGFADEEGVRFASTLLGSRAVAGTFDESVLRVRDADGISMGEALQNFGLDPDHIGAAARARRELLAYLELHIEQGPVLEAENLPVGVVTAIAGATRMAARLTGMAGHAGGGGGGGGGGWGGGACLGGKGRPQDQMGKIDHQINVIGGEGPQRSVPKVEWHDPVAVKRQYPVQPISKCRCKARISCSLPDNTALYFANADDAEEKIGRSLPFEPLHDHWITLPPAEFG